MEDFNIGAMKARNIAAQFGVIEKAVVSHDRHDGIFVSDGAAISKIS